MCAHEATVVTRRYRLVEVPIMNSKCKRGLTLLLILTSLSLFSGCHSTITNDGIPASLATNEAFIANCNLFKTSSIPIVRYDAARKCRDTLRRHLKKSDCILTFENIVELLGPPDESSELDLFYNLRLDSNPRLRLQIMSARPQKVDYVTITGEGDI